MMVLSETIEKDGCGVHLGQQRNSVKPTEIRDAIRYQLRDRNKFSVAQRMASTFGLETNNSMGIKGSAWII